MERADMAKKRRRVSGYDSVEESWKEIMKIDGAALYEQLNDPTKVTIIPYMGTRDPGKRPGRAFCFVGSKQLDELMARFLQLSPRQELLVIGPKGAGKSCLLRALADALYAVGGDETVVVCVWNMESARQPLKLVRWLLDGLHFAYFGRSERISVLQTICAMERELDGNEEDSPENIRLWKQRLMKFLRERNAAGDDLVFIVDGAQALDTCHHTGIRKDDANLRRDTRLTLNAIVESYKVVWGLSPRADQVLYTNLHDDDDKPIYKVEGFTEEQRNVFLSHSVLGTVVAGDAQRTRDLDMYAGFHPLSLDKLDEACMTVAAIKHRGDKQRRTKVREKRVRLVQSVLGLEPQEAGVLLEDEEDWNEVLQTFITGNTMTGIRRSVQRLVEKLKEDISRTFNSKEQMIEQDPRYSFSPNEFCSPFVEQIYVEEFRNARSASREEHGAWVGYAKVVLGRPSVNWSQCGWLCEQVCDDEISRKGMRITDYFVINNLSPQPFSKIPSSFPDLQPGYGMMYIPVLFNYGRVDGVILYRAMGGTLHLVGVQFTTNVDKHRHSEDEFMAASYLKTWMPDVVELVEAGSLALDFVFVCTTQTPSHEQRPGTYRELRNRACVGTLEHSLHVIGFDYALFGRSSPDVISVLRLMSQRRESVFDEVPGVAAPCPVPKVGEKGQVVTVQLTNGEEEVVTVQLTTAEVKKLKRAELNAYGLQADLDVASFRRKEDLRDKLIEMKVIQIVEKKN